MFRADLLLSGHPPSGNGAGGLMAFIYAEPMKRPRILLLVVAACLVAAQIDSLNAAVSFRGVPGSYAASNDDLGGGAQTLTEWTIELWVRPNALDTSYGLFDIHGNWKQTTTAAGTGKVSSRGLTPTEPSIKNQSFGT